jgi:hypothetical protein
MPPLDLLNLYNRLVMLLVTTTKRVVSPTTVAVATATALQAFLEAGAYPVGPYLAAAFARGNWAHQPKLAALKTPSYVSHYLAHTVEAAHWWNAVKPRVGATDPVGAGQELVKRRMLADGGPDFCRAQPLLTGGFNAASSICTRCPAKVACRG